MLVLSNEQIADMLNMEECIAVLEEAYLDLWAEKALNSPRLDNMVPCAREDAYYAFKHMGGTWPRRGIQALRINSDIITHPSIGGTRRRVKIPAAGGRWVGLVELFSTETGELLAIFPDGVMQRMRVGATNGIAAKYMSRPESDRVGMIGTGWQAGAQLMALCTVRPVKEVKVYSQRLESREEFAHEYSAKLGIPVHCVNTPEKCAEDVDILLAATSSLIPVIKPEWLLPGMHVSCIKTQEVDRSVIDRCSMTVVHSNKQAKQMNNIMPMTPNIIDEHLKGWWNQPGTRWQDFPDLSSLVAGKVLVRSNPGEITCFVNNVGIGLQFAAVGALILEKAIQAGLGTALPGEWFSESVHP